MSTINADQKASIEAAVALAEQATSAEFVVAVLPDSRSYAQWRALGTALTTFLVSLGGHLLWVDLSSGWILAAQPVIAAAVWLLLGVRPLLMLLVPDGVEISAVADRAAAIFIDAGLHRTGERGGVLLLVSLRERRVQLLADEKARAALPPERWAAHVDTLVRHLSKGELAQALSSVLDSLGKELSLALPRQALQTSALSNELRSR
jgi:putative membrane protein